MKKFMFLHYIKIRSSRSGDICGKLLARCSLQQNFPSSSLAVLVRKLTIIYLMMYNQNSKVSAADVSVAIYQIRRFGEGGIRTSCY